MQKKYVCVCLVLGSLWTAYGIAMEYRHKLEADNMTMYWTIEKDQIHVKLTARTTGWVAMGFDPENAMQGANIIIGTVENGQVRIEDHYGVRKMGHSPDEKLGGENHVLNPEGLEADGVTTLSFTLPLDSGEKWDKPIQPDGISRVMIAYGSGQDSFTASHAYRALYEINYSTGESKKLK